nr:MAG TPA: hypothetical protein [Caudoviricetes sp.]
MIIRYLQNKIKYLFYYFKEKFHPTTSYRGNFVGWNLLKHKNYPKKPFPTTSYNPTTFPTN